MNTNATIAPPDESPKDRPHSTAGVARLVLGTFLATFILARVIVLLIMLRSIPTLYLHVKGSHIHHLNYGIFLLAGVGAGLLFLPPRRTMIGFLAIVYGVGLALTFDEFGMWVHLGGPYWQRASFDAIVVITAVLGLIAVAPTLWRFRPRHIVVTCLLAVGVGVFTVVLVKSLTRAADRISPFFEQIELKGPEE
jgi:hypothetical protein